MKRSSVLAAGVALIACAVPLTAQTSAGGVAAVKPLYERLREVYVRSAEVMPESNYGFKPVDQVRTFGQLLGHVANENYLFCANAKGEANPNSADFEQTTAKAAMIQALRASFAYCDPAYSMTDAKAQETTRFFGQQGSRLWVLIFNVTHDSEHYGNIVTYLRLKGLVPPSSQGGG